ncbi:hypothetical protein AVEN_140265-1 [Araneus ventricosus]|uniref:Uncharacterized protein n=1 Tax=Araneus ventricosus TaxID=182803 RepID=A0A4Y2SZB2_ARAVE|nr:hypothetical protein AVEN_140265-1 [Araneus ventricosus]
MSHLDFRLQLVEELDKIYGESKHSSQNITSSDRLTGRHFPSRIQPTQKKKAPTKICIVCSQKFNEKGQRPGSRENLVASKPGVIFRSEKQNGTVLSFTAMPESGTPAARSFVKNERAAIDGHLRLELPVLDKVL